MVTKEETRCLSNALLTAGLRCDLPAAFNIPSRVRALLGEVDVRKVSTVTIHQCPQPRSAPHYRIEVTFLDGKQREVEFDGFSQQVLYNKVYSSGFHDTGRNFSHETYVLYDRKRDGAVTHLHVIN